MARTVRTEYTDDIDGSTDDVRPVQIVVPYEYAEFKSGRYAPSTSYELDLSRANRDKLAKALEPFVKHARHVTGYNPDSLRPGEGEKIRAWAAKNKIELKGRGRIPNDVVQRYREEND